VFVHPDRIHVAVSIAPEASKQAAESAGLRVRPKASRPPQTLVFVERAADVKAASDVFEDAAASLADDDAGGQSSGAPQ
jgi:hypothetical protein